MMTMMMIKKRTSDKNLIIYSYYRQKSLARWIEAWLVFVGPTTKHRKEREREKETEGSEIGVNRTSTIIIHVWVPLE